MSFIPRHWTKQCGWMPPWMTSSLLRSSVPLSTSHPSPAAAKAPSHQLPGLQSAYVHLPFCKRRCYYCDFPIQVVGSRVAAGVKEAISSYTELVCQEIRQTPRIGHARLATVFFGGGTPSLTPPADIHALLSTLDARFGFEEEMEISMEADPGTFDSETLRQYIDFGINRISLGVQSFDDGVLKSCGRSHDAAEALKAATDIRSSDIRSWSLDLISGLPDVSIADWRCTIEAAIRLDPDHVSIYDLQIEPSTAFDRWYRPEQSPLPSNVQSAEMYAMASDLLKSAGYEHYEISNYAKPGHRCQHNMTYWSNRPFYGFGLGATSNTGIRLARPKKMKGYQDWVEAMPRTNEASIEAVDNGDTMLETIMLRLRLSDGIDVTAFRHDYGEEAAGKLIRSLQPFREAGLVHVVEDKAPDDESVSTAKQLRLSDPDGFLVSNSIIAAVFASF